MVLLAALSFAVLTVMAARQALGQRTVGFLRDVPPLADGLPKVSAVIAACDEERGIEAALRSVLSLDYPGLEVIVVDDRSSDSTPAILARVARDKPGLRLVRVESLPAGWLGKNHALHRGAAAASGEFLLFTDADVVYEPTAVRRALAAMRAGRLDHLTVSPELRMRGTLLNMFAGTFILFFDIFVEPWKAKDPRSHAHVGIGAFNLVRASAYKAVGGHAAIAMRPDDDLKLGKIIKKAGFRQDILFGLGMIKVAWYNSVPELVRGLMKNTFAGIGYSTTMAAAAIVSIFVVFFLPFLGMVFASGTTQALSAAAVAALVFAHIDNTRFTGLPAWHAAGLPVTLLLWLYIIARSTLTTLARGGIVWRGTFYPLAELRRNVV